MVLSICSHLHIKYVNFCDPLGIRLCECVPTFLAQSSLATWVEIPNRQDALQTLVSDSCYFSSEPDSTRQTIGTEKQQEVEPSTGSDPRFI